MGNFSEYYFNNSGTTIKKAPQVVTDIVESEYNSIVAGLSGDYKLVIESEEYSDDYGYGYKFLLRDGESLFCINRYKDEVENDSARLFCTEEISNMIRQKYTN